MSKFPPKAEDDFMVSTCDGNHTLLSTLHSVAIAFQDPWRSIMNHGLVGVDCKAGFLCSSSAVCNMHRAEVNNCESPKHIIWLALRKRRGMIRQRPGKKRKLLRQFILSHIKTETPWPNSPIKKLKQEDQKGSGGWLSAELRFWLRVISLQWHYYITDDPSKSHAFQRKQLASFKVRFGPNRMTVFTPYMTYAVYTYRIRK